MGSVLGLGRGKKVTQTAEQGLPYTQQGFNYLQSNPVIQQSQGLGTAAGGALGAALGLGGGGGYSVIPRS